MDNDNKINEEFSKDISKGVHLFLSDSAFANKIEKPELYDLEAEYAKTKKNRSAKNYIVLFVTIAVVALVSFALSMYINYKNSSIDVGIDVFDDINLKGLLNMVGQVKNDIASSVDEKANLEIELENELAQLDLKLEAEKDLISQRRIDNFQKKKQIEQLEENYKAEKNALTSDYERRISIVDKRITELEEQLEKYESNNIKMEEAQKLALDSERQLFELEKLEQKKEYEEIISALRKKLQEQQKQAVLDQKRAVEIAVAEYKQRINQLDPVIEDEKVKGIMNSLHPEFEDKKEIKGEDEAFADRILAQVSEAAKNENEGYVFGEELLKTEENSENLENLENSLASETSERAENQINDENVEVAKSDELQNENGENEKSENALILEDEKNLLDETSQIAKIGETSELAKTEENSETLETSENSFVLETSERSENQISDESVEVAKNVEIQNEIAKNENGENSLIAEDEKNLLEETSQIAKIGETSELSKTEENSENFEISENSFVLETSERSENQINDESVEVAKNSEIANEVAENSTEIAKNEKSENQNANFLKIFKTSFNTNKNQNGEKLFGDDFENVNKSMNDMKVISDYVDAIPFENGLSKYVVAMEELASSANRELKVQATEKINQQTETLDGLTKYFDSIYLDEKGNAKRSLSGKDAVIISKTENEFICYVVPKKRSKIEKLRGEINNGDGTFKYLKLQKVGKFVVAIPENPSDFVTIQVNTTFVLK